MLPDLLVPFAAVCLAEMGDKTQIAVLILASRTRRHATLLAGVMAGFALVDGLAVAAGGWLSHSAPLHLVRAASGAVFIVLGLLMLRAEGDGPLGDLGGRGPFLSGFVTVSLMEFGDKTQLAAALFATEYSPPAVLAGTLAGLLLLSAAAVYVGRRLTGAVSVRTIHRLGAAAFIVIGASFVLAGA